MISAQRVWESYMFYVVLFEGPFEDVYLSCVY